MTRMITCPACDSAATTVFHTEHDIPTNSCLLLADRAEAEGYPRGEMELRLCNDCGFIFNARFDRSLAEYSSRYEETQGFSARFNEFARDLARRWVDRHDLHGSTVLEIGCGKGEFLEMMCEAGAGKGIGIDPSAHPGRLTSEAASRIEWITDFYSEQYTHLQADAVVCRHTLEHISPVGEFMRMVRRSIGDRLDTVVLFELPDVRRVLEEAAFWDVYYEHCSYFSAGSLGRLFRSCGFDVHDIALEYDDQYLILEATPSPTIPSETAPLPIEDDLVPLAQLSARFETTFEEKLTSCREQIDAADGSAVIWGAGSKGVAFLTALGDTGGIDYAVDINPHKHGMYMAGTGQEIVAPEFLAEYRPELVIAMNPVYLNEIREDLDRVGAPATVVAV